MILNEIETIIKNEFNQADNFLELFCLNTTDIFSFENEDDLYIAYVYESDRIWDYYEIFLAKTDYEKISNFIHNRCSLRNFFEKGVIFLLSSQSSISMNSFSLEEIIAAREIVSNLDFNWINPGTLDERRILDHLKVHAQNSSSYENNFVNEFVFSNFKTFSCRDIQLDNRLNFVKFTDLYTNKRRNLISREKYKIGDFIDDFNPREYKRDFVTKSIV